MKSKQKQNRVFSTEFKKEKVKLIENGKLKVSEISKTYDVSVSAVYKWLSKYGKLKRDERMVVEKESEAVKTLSLMRKIGELEQLIGRQQVELVYKETIIELGTELLGEDLKKKFNSLPSKK
jgi:transposase-like protein